MLSLILLAVPTCYFVLLASWHLLRRRLTSKHSGLMDLPLLKSRHPDKKIVGTVVICGGSVAGLLAARVLNDHFERVIVVEAEAWVASEEGRKIDGWDRKLHRSRVLQYASLHGVQSFLVSGLKQLFPDLEDECRRSEISFIPSNPRFTLSGVPLRLPLASYKSELPKNMYLSRSGFETLLRRLILDKDAYPNIELVSGMVTDMLPDPADHSLLGRVVVRTDTGVQDFPAALVADCTGPARSGIKWLGQHKLRYSSMTFRVDQAWFDRLPLPPGVINEGPARESPVAPDESHGTLKTFIEGLTTVAPIPGWVFQIISMLEEVRDSASVALLKIPPTTYVRYHQATNLPSNWVALGDSVMTVNPLFTEGCTKAFKGALALHNVLRATPGNTLPSDFSTKFFAEQFNKIDLMWQNTRLIDYGVPTTEPLSGESLSAGV
ncbi:hypothetical protein DFH06DRAFT_1319082 [Mycena polygramma]|nr:hypothetical protein DFH06DRAFT_1319082 [Mycena polygramma]